MACTSGWSTPTGCSITTSPGGTPQVRGLLADQVAYLRALLDAHETSGETDSCGARGSALKRPSATFAAEDGGFYDRVPQEAALGRLDVPDRPIVENGLLAEWLLRLAALTGESGTASGRARRCSCTPERMPPPVVCRRLRPRACGATFARSDGPGRRRLWPPVRLPRRRRASARRLDRPSRTLAPGELRPARRARAGRLRLPRDGLRRPVRAAAEHAGGLR